MKKYIYSLQQCIVNKIRGWGLVKKNKFIKLFVSGKEQDPTFDLILERMDDQRFSTPFAPEGGFSPQNTVLIYSM